MNTQQVLDCERNQLNKLNKFIVFPNQFKTIGFIVAILAFISKIILGFWTDESQSLQFFSIHVIENIILLALLVMVLSKEKIEDELVDKHRGQAFMFAFVTGVFFTIFQPIITFFVELLIKSGNAEYDRFDDFVILWFLLVMYLAYFHLLRKTG